MSYSPSRLREERPDEVVLIYALSDPYGVESIRYIGQTSKSLDWRLAMHLRDAAHPRAHMRVWPRIIWIRSLLAEGKQPAIRLLLTTDRAHAHEVERATIEEYERNGAPLVNGVYTRSTRELHRTLATERHRRAGHKMST